MAPMKQQDIFQTRIIDTWNRECARRRRSIVLRVPQPHRFGHCAFVEYEWTKLEAEQYLETGRLPCDLATVNHEANMIALWLFASNKIAVSRFLPELELDVVPDFQNMPAYCILDMGKDRFRQQQIALMPSELLHRVPTRYNTVQYILKNGRTIDRFTTKADLKSLEALEARIFRTRPDSNPLRQSRTS